MDQQQQQPAKPEDLVHKLKPWWGVAIVGLLALGAMGGALAIHYAGEITPAKKVANYQKADDSWIDHEPDRVAHASASTTPAASSVRHPRLRRRPRRCRPINRRGKTTCRPRCRIRKSSSAASGTRRRSRPT